jgi:hypothetical protein
MEQVQPPRLDVAGEFPPRALEHLLGDLNAVNRAAVTRPLQKHRQADTSAEANIRDALTRVDRQRIDRRGNRAPVSSIEQDRYRLPEQSARMAELPGNG